MFECTRKKATEKTSTTDEKHSIKSTDSASQADTQDTSGMSSSPESPLSGKNNESGQADDIHKKSETSKSQVLTPAEETAVDVTDTEEQQSQAPKEKELQTHLLNNNPNLMVLLHNQNTAQTRPAVTAEKPKQTSPKNPTLEEFLFEQRLLSECQGICFVLSEYHTLQGMLKAAEDYEDLCTLQCNLKNFIYKMKENNINDKYIKNFKFFVEKTNKKLNFAFLNQITLG